MMREDLLEAIGNLDDKILAETEATASTASRRTIRRVVLVAALVAGLAVSAGAVPLIHSAVQGGTMKTDETAYFTPTNPANGESHRTQRHEITLDVQFDEAPPEQIEMHYMLSAVPDKYTQYHGQLYRGARTAQFGWKSEEGNGVIFFTQHAAGTLNEYDLRVSVFTPYGQIPKHGLRVIAGIQGYLIEEPAGAGLAGSRRFVWSDGAYLFCLEVPVEQTDEELNQLLTGIRPIEDISDYILPVGEEGAGNLE